MAVPRDDSSLEVRAVADGALIATVACSAWPGALWWSDDRTLVVQTVDLHTGKHAFERHEAATGQLIEQSAGNAIAPT